MTKRLAALTPFVLGAIVLTSASTLTFAAVRQGKPAASKAAAAAKPRKTAVVPDVKGQAYVFAKGILEDAGFAWKVKGARGYAANLVSGQSPAGGTIVVDTGAPTVALTLVKNSAYRESGTPDDSAPYVGTRMLLPGQVVKAAKPKAAAKPKPGAKPASSPAAKPAMPAQQGFRGGKLPSRPPAFVSAGAPPEPLDEMPLPARARLLAAWLERHPEKSDANLQHWVYQHAWVVYGAKFGWWHGAEALRILIKSDERVQKLWGIGSGSETSARGALDYVTQRAH